MKRTLLVVAIVAAVAGAGYAYYRFHQTPEPPTVNTARITRGDVAEAVGATGQLQAVTTVQVGTQVSGTILELNADFNSLVRKGQVLARLDPSLFQTQIEQARANLLRSEADTERLRVALDDTRTKLARARELSEKKLIALTELEAAEVAVRSAEAQLRSQQASVTQSQASLRQNEVNLQHTVIESPIDGLVISRNVDVGQTVAASMSAPTLFILAADLTKMQVIASLDESDVGRIRPKQTVRFRVDAYPNAEFVGSVTQIRLQPTTIQNVVTYQTVIDVPNPELRLKPGMTATVSIEIARKADVLRVPNAALRFRPTADMFTAFGQTPPPAGRGRGAGGAGGDTRMTPSADEPAAGLQPTRSQRPAQQVSAPQPAAQRPETRARGGSGNQAEAPGPAAQGASTAGRGADPPPAAQAGVQADSVGPAGASDTAGGRGRGAGRRGNFAERLAAMSPEEREQAMERMRARGIQVPADSQPGAGAPDGRGQGAAPLQTQAPARSSQPSRGAAPSTGRQAPPATQSGATTFDALFAPLPPTESFGQAWLHQDGKLQRVRLRLGISDGQQTELLQALDSTVGEGTEVVTNIVLGSVRTATAPAGGAAFPGLETGGRRGGGIPGGGGGRGF